jgi:hypothetical protein
MIQIGKTTYPNLGFNALQRHPESWGDAALVAIDDSFITTGSGSFCARGDFLSQCADALAEINVRVWNSKALSLDLQWTIHSLSSGDLPFQTSGTSSTAFGEGQSLGFRLAKNLSPTLGVSIGANRLIHLDETTDLPKNLYLIGTKVFRLEQKEGSAIISLSLGLATDVYNERTNLGTVKYPKWLRGGIYPSFFAQQFDPGAPPPNIRGYYPNVAGVTSPFVCANQSIFIFKPVSAANPNCIESVYFGPVASIGIAPWPWLGFYAIYEGNVNIGISLKPFKNIPWNISFNAVGPITGINTREDDFIREYPCKDLDLTSCRTRLGIYTQLAF